MINTNFFTMLIAICFGIFMLKNNNSSNMITEAFGMNPSMTTKVDVEVAANSNQASKGNFQSVLGTYHALSYPEQAMKGDFYTVPGTYQASLSPRFSGSVDYGANIRYNLPSYENQAVPCNPLTFGKMAAKDYKENFEENYGCSGGPVSCGKGGAPFSFSGGAPETEPNYAAGNYNEVLANAYSKSQYPEITSTLPIGDMTSLNSLGEEDTDQPIVYDRYIYACRNSRLRSLGDPIRGDLPITPCESDWFRPSVQPNIDLQEGAMQVLGGVNNETANALADLIYTSSGNTAFGIGGVSGRTAVSHAYSLNPQINMANNISGYASAGRRDVSMTAFP